MHLPEVKDIAGPFLRALLHKPLRHDHQVDLPVLEDPPSLFVARLDSVAAPPAYKSVTSPAVTFLRSQCFDIA